MQDLVAYAGSHARFPGSLRRFRAAPPSLDEAQERIRADVERREERFLDLRRRSVYDHSRPSSSPIRPPAACCENLVPGVPPSVVEWPTDTARAIAGLVFSGTAARCPLPEADLTYGGETMPSLVERFARLPVGNSDLAARVPPGVTHELRRFFYDAAQATGTLALNALLRVVAPSQVLFGSDFPYRTAREHAEALEASGLASTTLLAVERENAPGLMPRLGV